MCSMGGGGGGCAVVLAVVVVSCGRTLEIARRRDDPLHAMQRVGADVARGWARRLAAAVATPTQRNKAVVGDGRATTTATRRSEAVTGRGGGLGVVGGGVCGGGCGAPVGSMGGGRAAFGARFVGGGVGVCVLGGGGCPRCRRHLFV